jgi:hypothetical protein
MATEILAIGQTEANSADVTVAAGDTLTVALKGLAGTFPRNAVVHVQLKDDDNAYNTVDTLKSSRPALVITAGSWRFSRRAGEPCGVFSA